jgi:hypothetical protein
VGIWRVRCACKTSLNVLTSGDNLQGPTYWRGGGQVCREDSRQQVGSYRRLCLLRYFMDLRKIKCRSGLARDGSRSGPGSPAGSDREEPSWLICLTLVYIIVRSRPDRECRSLSKRRSRGGIQGCVGQTRPSGHGDLFQTAVVQSRHRTANHQGCFYVASFIHIFRAQFTKHHLNLASAICTSTKC